MYPEYSVKELGFLSDPSFHNSPIDIRGCDADTLQHQLRMMIIIRVAEEKIAQLVIESLARCPCHLGIGQEAIATGISSFLRATDRVFGAHRSHSHYLALGGSITGLMDEILGKASGCSKGMGGSMHLYGKEVGFAGSVPIVAGTIPLAVGAALAAKKDGNGDIAVSYFGDGASEEGSFHESLNLASSYKLPVLFVCENNFYASHLDISYRQPSDRISRFADAHNIPVELVDGNDVVAVANAARRLTTAMREGQGPGFLEAVTYRWRGHVGPDENIDVGVRRKVEDIDAWKKRDPIRRLADAMVAAGIMDNNAFKAVQTDVETEISIAVENARTAPYPGNNALTDYVFASLERPL